MAHRLRGRIALVVEADADLAAAFAADGACVLLGGGVGEVHGPSAAIVALDPTDPDAWRAAVRTCVDRFGAPPDLLVTAAPPTPASPPTVEALRTAYDGGVVALLNGLQAVAPGMRAADRGAVVAITGSVSGPCPARVAAAATVALVKCAALDLGRTHIRVNAVEPGSAPPESVVRTALFLASDESSWITGTAVSAGHARD
ncbi:SDR family oxidoreductase [Pseudonocardia halophobica]|uniref:SDR family oxidoreductase n=1 Tax=Pseudonocardia halophobica TaxID=29401 RepID=UPI003D90546B